MFNLFMRHGLSWRYNDNIRWHLGNLREDRNYRPIGSWLRAGRWWLNLWQTTVSAEWYWFMRPNLAIGVNVGGGEGDVVQFRLSLLICKMYLTLENWRWHSWITAKIKRPDEKYGNGREIGCYWNDGALWVNLWNDPMEWRSTDPNWHSFAVHFDDWILGKRQYSSEVLAEHKAVPIPMPEKTYQADIKLELATWKRPRWFARRVYRADIECKEGIPHPGKGESAHDCGQDRTYGLTCPASSLSEAVSKMVASVMSSRERHGSGITDVG